jgi:hypothetical protein
MPSIEILDSGRIDERESAFPQAVQLSGGDVLCSFSVGGGALVTGGTDWARSSDGGKTWTLEGTILPPDAANGRANFLKLSLAPGGGTVYAYGSWISADVDRQFGERSSGAILCRSTDEGRTWTPPVDVPFPVDCPLEVSHGLLPLKSGRLLAPAATLPAKDRLGEQVLVAVSDDDGQSWSHRVVFEDPEKRYGYFEQKLAEVGPDRIIATAWTVTLCDYVDQTNSFAVSSDGGWTWSAARSTGIHGQTMTPVPLGEDRLLVLYNRRYGDQGIVMCLIRFTDERWTVDYEGLMYDARRHYQRPADVQTGIDELDHFEFGFPTAIVLNDRTVLATHWCVENEKCGIRWTRLHVLPGVS